MAVDKFCDFCHEPNPRLAFPVEDFAIPLSGVPSSGGFAACGICAAMVEANDRAGLLKRTLTVKDNGWSELPQDMRSEGDKAVRLLHDRFWQAMDKLPSKKPIEIESPLSDKTEQRVADLLKWPIERVRDVLRKGKIVSEQKVAGGGGVRATAKDIRDIDAVIAALDKILDANADRKKLDEEVRQLFMDYYAERIVLPPDFAPFNFAGFLSYFLPKAPDIAIDLAMLAGAVSRTDISVGIDHIQRLEEQRLLLFAKNLSSDNPALFIAPEKHFASVDDIAIANKLLRFFDTTGSFDAANGAVTDFDGPLDVLAQDAPVGILGRVLKPNDWTEKYGVKAGDPVFKLAERTFADWRNEFPLAITTMAEECRVSRRVVEETLNRWVTDKLIRFVEVPGKDERSSIGAIAPKEWPKAERRSEELLRAMFIDKFEFGHRFKASGKAFMSETGEKPGAVIFPTAGMAQPSAQLTTRRGETAYARAIEMQYAALSDLSTALISAQARGVKQFDGLSIDVLFTLDVEMLKKADTFCWFEDPMHAVEAAASSLPTTVRLTRELAPNQAAWWFFKKPMQCATVTHRDTIIALLFGWVVLNGRSGLQFSAYIYDDFDSGTWRPTPTTKFFWEEGTTLNTCIKTMTAKYDELYSPENIAKMIARANLLDRDRTLAAIEQLSRFFAAGALWTHQKILTYSKGHVERHERKRVEKLLERPLNDVQLIQLRRKESATRPDESSESRTVNWTCRWVVDGFWREQYYPSKGRHEPKWINSFVKGPDDKPLRVPTHRVYVVNR